MDHPSSFELEAHHFDPQPGKVAEHVAGCGVCGAYLETLNQAQAEQLKVEPPEAFARKIALKRRASVQEDRVARTARWPWAKMGVVLAGAAALVFSVWGTDPSPEAGWVARGGSPVGFSVVQDGAAVPLESGAALKSGAVVQVELRATGHWAVFTEDAAGGFSFVFPERSDTSAEVRASPKTIAFQLALKPGKAERLYAWSQGTLFVPDEEAKRLQAARGGQALEASGWLPEGVYSVWVRGTP